MTTTRPSQLGLHHVALFVDNLEACVSFYQSLVGMDIEWQPDDDNVYLCSGNDNLALHRRPDTWVESQYQNLDHIGFILPSAESVDAWYDYLQSHDIKMKTAPKTHRDGARSFYCCDPAGNCVQFIHHPPITGRLA